MCKIKESTTQVVEINTARPKSLSLDLVELNERIIRSSVEVVDPHPLHFCKSNKISINCINSIIILKVKNRCRENTEIYETLHWSHASVASKYLWHFGK